MPITYLIGIDPEDIEAVSTMLGIKVLANEFLGFIELGKAQAAGTLSVSKHIGIFTFNNGLILTF